MLKIAGVKLPHSLKLTECVYKDTKLRVRDLVVIEGSQGLEVGEVVFVGKKINEGDSEESKIIRIATKEDIDKKEKLEEKSKEAFDLYLEKISKYDLKMNPIGVSYSLDESKIVFYYTSDGRVDFRELARDLSRSLKKQAIMRQIGPRDEAKLIGGYGRCGRSLCCATFMTSYYGITMGDAENVYGMPKNASKISGLCGRLMCCIKFDDSAKGTKK